jgi:hypothetical protein
VTPLVVQSSAALVAVAIEAGQSRRRVQRASRSGFPSTVWQHSGGPDADARGTRQRSFCRWATRLHDDRAADRGGALPPSRTVQPHIQRALRSAFASAVPQHADERHVW